MIHIAIIEDEQEILNSLINFFGMQPEIKIVQSSNSVEDFFEHLQEPASIDVLLLDIMLPGISGIEAIPSIRAKMPSVKILINTVLDDTSTVFNALKMGAIGYITKETSLSNIKSSVVNAYNGLSTMTPSIAAKILDFFTGNNTIAEKLTEKEMAVAESLKLGMSYKLIAYENNVTIDAIRHHVKNIYKKLEINSKGELINLMSSRNN
jgi:DNA-binding NarL/FixJ family response regulator